MPLRSVLRRVPGLGPLLHRGRVAADSLRFPGSAGYWERRYKRGGNSGAGSYGALASFKADFLNDFVREHGIRSVIEFGCGDGAQLSLANYPAYVGLDVAPSAVQRCIDGYARDRTKSFLLYTPTHFANHGALTADLAISLDVILHLVEDDVLDRYLEQLFAAAKRYVIVFTEDQKPSPKAAHVRYRNVADWLPMVDGWSLIATVPNPHHGTDTAADFFLFAPSVRDSRS